MAVNPEMPRSGRWLPSLALLILATSATPSWAEGSSASPPDAPTRKSADSSMDFNLLGDDHHTDAAAAVASAALERQVVLRRHMLQLHQGLGFATLAALAAADVVGQLNLDDRYGGGGVKNQYELLHISLATLTLGLFASVAVLGLFAPTPYSKPLRLDTALVHKLFMTLATAGMVAQVVLGILASAHTGSLSQRDFVLWHQVSGYTSLGAMAAGATVLLF